MVGSLESKQDFFPKGERLRHVRQGQRPNFLGLLTAQNILLPVLIHLLMSTVSPKMFLWYSGVHPQQVLASREGSFLMPPNTGPLFWPLFPGPIDPWNLAFLVTALLGRLPNPSRFLPML